MRHIINFDNVSYVRNGKFILNELTFSIEKGTFVSIIGGNGSGKSTLVKVLAGLVSYDGYININGYSLNSDNIKNVRKKVGVVLSDMDNFLIGETVSDELVISLENLGKDSDYVARRLNDIANMFNIYNILNKNIRDLTNSEKQMVFIASALISLPDILIIDDCMHQLLVKDRRLVLEILKKYKKEKNMTIIMITHDMEDIMDSDRIIVMDKGKIVMDGTVVSVFKKYSKLFNLGIKVPFVIDLSLRLMNKGVLSHVYLDMGKLVDDLWKLN